MNIRPRAALIVASLIAMCGFVLAGCGGEEREATVNAAEVIRSESPLLARAYGNIAACDLNDTACLESAGRTGAQLLGSAIDRLEARKADIGGECAERTLDSFIAYARSIRALAIAARDGNDIEEVFATTTARSDAFISTSADCGLAPQGGSAGEMLTELSPIFVRLGEAGTALGECADFACASDAATQLETAARDGLAIIEPIPESFSACEQDVLGEARDALTSYRDGAQLLQEGDSAAAEPLFNEGTAHESAFATKMSDCIN